MSQNNGHKKESASFELSPFEDAFIESYIAGDFNGTRTMLKLRPELTTNSAGVLAARVLRNDRVRDGIVARIAHSLTSTAAEVIGGYVEESRADIALLLDENGDIDPQKVRENGRIVKSYSITESPTGKIQRRVQLVDAKAARDKLAEWHKLLPSEKPEQNSGNRTFNVFVIGEKVQAAIGELMTRYGLDAEAARAIYKSVAPEQVKLLERVREDTGS